MPFLQDIIHKFEVGGGMRFLRIGLIVLALLMLIVGYNWRAYRNMSTQEAMDAAQLGRNIARGRGYTTLCIQPFSMFLLKRRNLEYPASLQAGHAADPSRIRGN